MKRYLRLASFFLCLLTACGSPYRKLTPVESAPAAQVREQLLRFKPVFEVDQKELYRCHIDGRFLFKKFHLSGILIFKHFADGSTRAVFANEMGYTFFDFGWDSSDSFKVNSVISRLDKAAVVNALRKDLTVLLMRDIRSVDLLTSGDAIYYRSALSKGYAYYIVENTEWKRAEIAGKRPVTSIHLFGKDRSRRLADSISIVHHTAHFTINAKKINDVAAE